MTTFATASRRRVLAATTTRLAAWTTRDTAWALGWMVAAIAARALLVARIEGALDHDQSVVGLMALDIAAGRRWPLFFDGQRYMGALEPYTAAAFVAVLGHSPGVVALAPLLFFGLFAAGQFVLWRSWADRPTGHLAAALTILGAPMPAIWSIVPRGGYVEVLAWALAVLGLYRHFIRPEGGPQSRLAQAGWGFLLAAGYVLNPLSLIVYLMLALDWTLGRHGFQIRHTRGLGAGWVDSTRAPLIWLAIAATAIVAVAACCHVDFQYEGETTPFVFAMGWLPKPWGPLLGVVGIAAIAGAAIGWSGAGARVVRLLAGHLPFTLGMIAALSPFVIDSLLARWGILPKSQSLPIWIRAPWNIGVNLCDGREALGILVGCRPDALGSLGFEAVVSRHAWPGLSRLLQAISPVVVVAATALIVSVAWRDRRAWQRLWTLRGNEPTPPTVLALTGLAVTATLYALQATSLNSFSIRYLFPAWVFLPGLLAVGLRALPGPSRRLVTAFLIVPWALAQANLWADMDRPCPERPLARALERRGVRGIVAQTPLALTVANLSHGHVGAIEYRPSWPRLRDRYADRFPPGQPVTCVVDLDFLGPVQGSFGWSPDQDLRQRLRELDEAHPGCVHRAWQLGRYEVWDVDLPLAELAAEAGSPLLPHPESAKVANTAL